MTWATTRSAALPPGFERLRMAGATSVELCRVADGSVGAYADAVRASDRGLATAR